MVKAIINDEVILSYPDGFEEMDREQLKAAFLDDNPNRWGIKDEKRHMMVTVLWNRTNMLSAMITGPGTIADSAEGACSRDFERELILCIGNERAVLVNQRDGHEGEVVAVGVEGRSQRARSALRTLRTLSALRPYIEL